MYVHQLTLKKNKSRKSRGVSKKDAVDRSGIQNRKEISNVKVNTQLYIVLPVLSTSLVPRLCFPPN